MMEVKKQSESKKEAVKQPAQLQSEKKDTGTGAAQAVANAVYGREKRMKRRMGRGKPRREEKKDEFEQRILDLARVTRVMAGGKRMRFRACVVIGNRKGRVAVALGKGTDVTIAVTKAVNKAKKQIIDVPMVNGTIPHEIYQKTGAAKILFKPARKGRGVIAGGVVRIILELAGIHNITCKILGTSNKVNNAKCTIAALEKLRRVEKKQDDGKQQTVNSKQATKNL